MSKVVLFYPHYKTKSFKCLKKMPILEFYRKYPLALGLQHVKQ